MSRTGDIAAAIFKSAAGRRRTLVAIAGPPGAGKSALAEQLVPLLPEGSAAVVSMDGFHYDDAVLEARGALARKGAPETFDFDGFRHLLERLGRADAEVAVPVFDRSIEIARAGAAIVPAEARFVLVEGNYLLLDESPWYGLGPLFDMSIYLDVPRPELERRLVKRWLDHGHAEEPARKKVRTNDLPNAERVAANRRKADFVVGPE